MTAPLDIPPSFEVDALRRYFDDIARDDAELSKEQVAALADWAGIWLGIMSWGRTELLAMFCALDLIAARRITLAREPGGEWFVDDTGVAAAVEPSEAPR